MNHLKKFNSKQQQVIASLMIYYLVLDINWIVVFQIEVLNEDLSSAELTKEFTRDTVNKCDVSQSRGTNQKYFYIGWVAAKN